MDQQSTQNLDVDDVDDVFQGGFQPGGQHQGGCVARTTCQGL